MVPLWTCRSPPIIVLINIGAVAKSSSSFLSSFKFFSQFFIAEGPWQVIMWFRSSLGSWQTGQVCVSCCLLSKTVFENPHPLLSNFVSICRWALETLFIAWIDSSHSMRVGSFGVLSISAQYSKVWGHTGCYTRRLQILVSFVPSWARIHFSSWRIGWMCTLLSRLKPDVHWRRNALAAPSTSLLCCPHQSNWWYSIYFIWCPLTCLNVIVKGESLIHSWITWR